MSLELRDFVTINYCWVTKMECVTASSQANKSLQMVCYFSYHHPHLLLTTELLSEPTGLQMEGQVEL